eukprot:Skav208645  [mRNA]  locus=scaffold1081:194309:194737:- [translate_table: standard]
MSYTQVSAGIYHSVLLRSDGNALACGENESGECNILPPEPGVIYVSDLPAARTIAVQLDVDCCDDALTLRCSSLAGEERLRLNASRSDLVWEAHKRIAVALGVSLQSLRVVMQDGQLLAEVYRANAGLKFADLTRRVRRRLK